jgi:V/A-type H+-transporting ATPase subunit E
VKERLRRGRPRPIAGESGVQAIDALRQAILNQARQQARQLLREAQSEVQGVERRAREKAEEIRQEILVQGRHETTLEKQRQISAARLEVHREELSRREDQITGVFAAANERLEQVRHSDAYPQILQRLTVEAAAALGGGELRVAANREDAELLTGGFLARAARELEEESSLTRRPGFLEARAGVLVETADGHMRFDNTFDARLDRFRDQLRARVYGILTGSAGSD